MYTETETRPAAESSLTDVEAAEAFLERICDIINAGAQAGFENVDRHTFEHDPMNVWFVSRKENHHDS